VIQNGCVCGKGILNSEPGALMECPQHPKAPKANYWVWGFDWHPLDWRLLWEAEGWYDGPFWETQIGPLWFFWREN
jgi:hypothetical protein